MKCDIYYLSITISGSKQFSMIFITFFYFSVVESFQSNYAYFELCSLYLYEYNNALEFYIDIGIKSE